MWRRGGWEGAASAAARWGFLGLGLVEEGESARSFLACIVCELAGKEGRGEGVSLRGVRGS